MARGQDVKDAMATLAKATAAALEEIEAGRQAIGARQVELQALRLAPVPLKEAEARVPAAVRAAGAAWLTENGGRLVWLPMPEYVAREGRRDWKPSAHALGEPSDVGPVVLPFKVDDPLPFGALAAGDPATTERFLLGLLRARYQSITATVPLAEREGRITEAEAEIARLEREDEDRTDGAIAAGLNVSHRADVVKRREAEAYRAQREAQLDVERRKRLEAIDAEHAESVRSAGQ